MAVEINGSGQVPKSAMEVYFETENNFPIYHQIMDSARMAFPFSIDYHAREPRCSIASFPATGA
jgi:hypothetical protein